MTDGVDNLGALLDAGCGPQIIASFRRLKPPTKEDFYKQLRDDLLASVRRLENRRSHLHGTGEESITGRIVDMLAFAGYAATAETDVSGHADIVVRVPGSSIDYIAECKVWSRTGALNKGMLQLHYRYSAGNCPYSALLIYCFEPNALGILTAWREHVAREKLCQLQGDPTAVDPELSFESTHISEVSGTPIRTWHIIAKLMYAPRDAIKKR